MYDYQESVLWIQQGSHIYEFTAIKIYIRPVQSHSTQNPSMERGDVHDVSPPTKQLQANGKNKNN